MSSDVRDLDTTLTRYELLRLRGYPDEMIEAMRQRSLEKERARR